MDYIPIINPLENRLWKRVTYWDYWPLRTPSPARRLRRICSRSAPCNIWRRSVLSVAAEMIGCFADSQVLGELHILCSRFFFEKSGLEAPFRCWFEDRSRVRVTNWTIASLRRFLLATVVDLVNLCQVAARPIRRIQRHLTPHLPTSSCRNALDIHFLCARSHLSATTARTHRLAASSVRDRPRRQQRRTRLSASHLVLFVGLALTDSLRGGIFGPSRWLLAACVRADT